MVSLSVSHLTARAQTPPSTAWQTVIIFLTDQPQFDIAEQVWKEKQPQLQQISADMRALDPLARRLSQQPQPLTRQEEDRLVEEFAQQPLDEQTRQALQQKAEQIDLLRQQARKEILQRSQKARDASQNELIQRIEQLGGQILYRYQSVNALAVRIPASQLSQVQNLAGVQAVAEDQIRQALLDHSAPSIGAPFFWNAGFTGNEVDVAILDTGIDAGHPALAGKVLAQQRCLSSGIGVNDPSADDVNGHGTHVAGIVASQDSTYRGVAFGVRSVLNAKAGADSDGSPRGGASMADSDAMACVDWAINGNAYGADAINLSFGSPMSSDDSEYQRFWDAVVSQLNVLVAIAAGNSGSASYTLFSPSIADNVISVANVDDKNTSSSSNLSSYYSARNDDIIRPSSSRGPTSNGRKKPDIAAPGTSIMSTNNIWDKPDSTFIAYTGTSMASPHVAGAAALVMSRGVTDALAVKALMINTAQDLGNPGWDNAYGWGYLDLYNLNAHINDYFLDSLGPAPAFKYYAGPAMSSDAATLVWNRRVLYQSNQYPNTSYPLTNLDLYAYNESDNSQLSSSTSQIDNVEQVRFPANFSSVVVKVKDSSPTIDGIPSEPYALATQEGFQIRQGPKLDLLPSLEGDWSGSSGTVLTITLQIQNNGDLILHNPIINISGSDGLKYLSGSPLCFSTQSIAVNQTSSYQWVFEKTDNSPQTILIDVKSFSYGELYHSSWKSGDSPSLHILNGPSLCTYLPLVFK